MHAYNTSQKYSSKNLLTNGQLDKCSPNWPSIKLKTLPPYFNMCMMDKISTNELIAKHYVHSICQFEEYDHHLALIELSYILH